MPQKTSIEYVDYSTNPIHATYYDPEKKEIKRGHHCVHWDTTCEGCYAEAINIRFGTGLRFTAQNTSKIQFVCNIRELEALHKLDARLMAQRQWATCFVGDMTDLFQDGVRDFFLDECFKTFVLLRRIILYIFTKRADRLLAYTATHDFSTAKHLWFFVSAGEQKHADQRLADLMRARVAFRGISVEPMIADRMDLTRYMPSPDGFVVDPDRGPVHIDDGGKRLDWVFIGGGSGRERRPFHLAACRDLIRQCRESDTRVFVKQLGCHPYPDAFDFTPEAQWPADTVLNPVGKVLRIGDSKGGKPEQWAPDLRVREYPALKAELQKNGNGGARS